MQLLTQQPSPATIRQALFEDSSKPADSHLLALVLGKGSRHQYRAGKKIRKHPQLDPTLQFELEWVPSAFTSEPEGFFRLWSRLTALQYVDLLVSLDELDTFGKTVDSALLGAVSANGSVEGKLHFSEFRSRREDMAITF